MFLKGKSIFDWTKEDLRNLVAERESEGKSLEFKSHLPSNSDSDKKEFLADITSFANASGGYILYGVEEEEGEASDLPGLVGINQDAERLRLENIIRDGVAPRITGISIPPPIELSNGNYVLIVHIPQSWASPHMVTIKGASRFFSRNSAGKYQLDVDEIRQAFVYSGALGDKIRNFRLDRISKIGTNETFLPVRPGAIMILHFIPLTTFQTANPVDIQGAADKWYNLGLIDSRPNFFRFNLDGLVAYSPDSEKLVYSYSQLFRNGIVEAVNSFLLTGMSKHKKVIPYNFESEIIKACREILRFQQQLEIAPPIFVFLSLLGVIDYVMEIREPWRFDIRRNQVVDRDILLVPEVSLEHFLIDDLPQILRPLFDAVWNAAGWKGSIYYDDEGNWSPNKL